MRIFFILIFCISLLGCSNKEVAQEWIITEVHNDGTPRLKKSSKANADGLFALRELYPSGVVKIMGYLNNEERHGLWKSFYENQNLWSICDYTNGVREGRSMVYYQNGSLMTSGFFKNDKLDSTWVAFDEHGDTVGVTQYKHGTVIYSYDKTNVAPVN